MPLADTLEKLYKRTAFGIKPGLEVIRALLKALDDPQLKIPVIHIAGTNGKGSVAAMIESVLRTAGFKTALYTSPHLIHFNERFRINGQPIADETLNEYLQQIEFAADAVSRDNALRPATYFEISTALAYEYFAQEKVDIAIIETGMGGTWDATNVITPLLSVITRISMDHEEYLGHSLAGIADEKSGIIKKNVPVIAGAMNSEALEPLRSRAAALQAPLIEAEEYVSLKRLDTSVDGQRLKIETQQAGYPPVNIPLQGNHQMENVAVAVAALEMVADILNFELQPKIIKMGLEATVWPGRCQVLSREPLIILDGAHNESGGRALAQVLKWMAENRPIRMIVSFVSDKDVLAFMRSFRSLADFCWAVELKTDRAMPLELIESRLDQAGFSHEVAVLEEVLPAAKEWAIQNGGVVCITGSLYLAGEVLRTVKERLDFI